MAKAGLWADTDAHARKRGEQTGLDTLVVHALNDVDWLLGGLTLSVTKLTREVDRLGSTAARLKLKGIDGDPHKRWIMWINSMQREKPYLPLTCPKARRDMGVPERESEYRCCMAVVSSCREMLG